MMEFLFDAAKGRLHIRYTGFWTEDYARGANIEFAAYMRKLSLERQAFTLLDDLSEWIPQSQEVVELNKQFGKICTDMPIVRNAMLISSSLIRRQVLRTVDGIDCQLFATYPEADAWLSQVEPARRAI